MSRARAFDIDTAIDRALHEFWRKGYEGTSIADLTEALGINRPSLYAAFGNKEGLFRKALERYLDGPAAGIQGALEAPTARAAAERILYFHADAAGDARRPEGCLLVQGALACSEESEPIREALIEARRAGELALTERFKRAKAEGDLGSEENPAELSRYVWTVCHGLSVEASAGATRAEQRRVVARALRAFPESKSN
ncbi:MAG: TetR/AcrR family transcriptional regulator [Polyangiaceae bacterium]